ncbi:MAG: extracellular solute-binding protein [Opitutaceae bacterium]
MKVFFLLILAGLIAAGVATFKALPGHGERPVLYWVVDTGEFRERQKALFEKWMVDNGYPAVELRIDATNRDPTKKIVQAVSGVGGDIIDCSTGEVHLLESLGVAEDLTEMAREMGFEASSSYPAIEPELVIDGRQYAFPRNVGTAMLWSNLEAFERAGLDPPPSRWTLDEFEAIGRKYVKALNPAVGPRTTFFMPPLGTADRLILLRSMGGDIYNETMTASIFDSPESAEIYRRFYQWTNVDRLIPTKAESQSLASDSGIVPARMHLFATGQYGLMLAGRWGLIYYRPVGITRLGVSEMPYVSFRNTRIGVGSEVMYAGSKNKELAAYFFKFLASREFNDLIVEGADALPPVPAFASGDTFSRPAEFPNEWGLHDAFLDSALTNAIPVGMSPFILVRVMSRLELDAFERFMADRLTAEEAVRKAAEAINREIARTVSESVAKQQKYAALVEDQKTIDRLKAEGKPIPVKLIRNPFHLRYYAEKGWLE